MKHSLDETLQQRNNFSDPTYDLPTQIEGSDRLKGRIQQLLEKYRECFRRTVAKTPADVPPYEFDVDVDKWETSRQSKAPLRHKSGSKDAETRRQCLGMRDLDVIEPSIASSWSQVHLAPKDEGMWRFTLDYRFLNECTRPRGGVIPNIKQILERIGRQKAAYFAVLDLTSGYHQAPLAAACRAYTAFITSMGLFQWTRVPMGLKGAPAYFQMIMTTIVLVGLIWNILEVYLDDIIVYGRTEDEFVERLEKLLLRLKERRITLNPKKSRLGMSSIEYVGHIIDSTGLTYSPEKVKKVLDFAPPKLAKDLRSFIGLASYFSDKVENMQLALGPLRAIEEEFRSSKILRWTEEGPGAIRTYKRHDQQSSKDFLSRC